MLNSIPEERPVAFQLFGAEPEIMIEAAVILEEFGPDLIDINMGCPVRKVTKRGAGAALMTTPDIAEKIISGITAKVSVPVTVKFRSGKDSKNINAVEFATMAESSGAAAVTVHARTWAQRFSGAIDPGIIKEVKDTLTIPVIGNGDVLSRDQGLRLQDATGCDGVMIGRGALGNPWIFRKSGRPGSIVEITKGAIEHLSLIEQFLPADRILGYVKSQMSRYYRDLPGCSSFRKQIFDAADLAKLKQLLVSIENYS